MCNDFERIRLGLDEAIAFSKGSKTKAVVHEFSSIDVKSIREISGMSLYEFASMLGVSVSTLRHWEGGDRAPQSL